MKCKNIVSFEGETREIQGAYLAFDVVLKQAKHINTSIYPGKFVIRFETEVLPSHWIEYYSDLFPKVRMTHAYYNRELQFAGRMIRGTKNTDLPELTEHFIINKDGRIMTNDTNAHIRRKEHVSHDTFIKIIDDLGFKEELH